MRFLLFPISILLLFSFCKKEVDLHPHPQVETPIPAKYSEKRCDGGSTKNHGELMICYSDENGERKVIVQKNKTLEIMYESKNLFKMNAGRFQIVLVSTEDLDKDGLEDILLEIRYTTQLKEEVQLPGAIFLMNNKKTGKFTNDPALDQEITEKLQTLPPPSKGENIHTYWPDILKLIAKYKWKK